MVMGLSQCLITHIKSFLRENNPFKDAIFCVAQIFIYVSKLGFVFYFLVTIPFFYGENYLSVLTSVTKKLIRRQFLGEKVMIFILF
jgi:hypothetical protein